MVDNIILHRVIIILYTIQDVIPYHFEGFISLKQTIIISIHFTIASIATVLSYNQVSKNRKHQYV